ncbi:MAG TPA: carbonic anhydrase [Dyadobacter sp.]|jgi:carbonic anhydrase|nr:carbonic anhydrase [Dyadobacter sp.]
MVHTPKIRHILAGLFIFSALFSCDTKTEIQDNSPVDSLATDSLTTDSLTNNKETLSFQEALDSIYQSNAKHVYAMLLKGNNRYARDSAFIYRSSEQIPDSLTRKKPFFLLTDVDLPQSPDRIFDLRKSMFMQLSSPACLLDPKHVAVMEYAAMYSGTKVIMVLANSNSKMIGAACDNVQTGNFGSITRELNKAMTSAQEFADRSSANKNYVNNIAQNQATLSLDQITAQSPILKALADSGKVVLKSAYFDAAKGTVTVLEPKPSINTLTKK